ncbi:hypothetical protein FOZ62_007036 [Perkinsus olseni]|uniref:Uncharacterized protein n=1 Tax=Perkinsus olseni TaxID=32597 RepID=A0A7J6U4M3_PEROL|nr:hypothetical protein FOZ62_007036 [Perkinsus olseni]
MSIIFRLFVVLLLLLIPSTVTIASASAAARGTVSTELETLMTSLRAKKASKNASTRRNGSAIPNRRSPGSSDESLSEILGVLKRVVTGRRNL